MTKFKNIEINEETCGTAMAQAFKNRAKVINTESSETQTIGTETTSASKEANSAILESAKELANIVNDKATELQAALSELRKKPFSMEMYHLQFKITQKNAEELLDFELQLASVLNGLSTAQGVKPINLGDRKTKFESRIR